MHLATKDIFETCERNFPCPVVYMGRGCNAVEGNVKQIWGRLAQFEGNLRALSTLLLGGCARRQDAIQLSHESLAAVSDS
jgi:hypothetical protein